MKKKIEKEIKRIIKEENLNCSIVQFKDEVHKDIQLKTHHDKRTKKQKLNEVKLYAKKYNLKYDNEYLYAFRNHNCNGSGIYYKNIYYEKGIYYRDWHCNLNPSNQNSFGLGIFPKGNTPVKIKIEDWGCAVLDSSDGKGRVLGFEII